MASRRFRDLYQLFAKPGRTIPAKSLGLKATDTTINESPVMTIDMRLASNPHACSGLPARPGHVCRHCPRQTPSTRDTVAEVASRPGARRRTPNDESMSTVVAETLRGSAHIRRPETLILMDDVTAHNARVRSRAPHLT
jgi:hypothetical protein